MPFGLIACVDQHGVIGVEDPKTKSKRIPWHVSEELKHFKQTTDNSMIVMGYDTYVSMNKTSLPNRVQFVCTRKHFQKDEKHHLSEIPTSCQFEPSVPYFLQDLDVLVRWAEKNAKSTMIWIIGGRQLYEYALSNRLCSVVLISHLHFYSISEMKSNDTISEIKLYFPLAKLNSFYVTQKSQKLPSCVDKCSKNNVDWVLSTYIPKENKEEQNYLELLQKVMLKNQIKSERTGIGCLFTYGEMLKFDLSKSALPLLTTKKMSFVSIAKELFWFLNGSTDSKILNQSGVKIWDANGSRSFLDKLGFTDREEGDLGPVYGHQWRYFDAPYKDCKSDYKGQGIDQVATILNLLKTDPGSRRMILSAWNPKQLKEMALPPCHVMCHFSVYENKLSAMLFQRSADLGLGTPYNIASYALLVHLMAHASGFKPGELIYTTADSHIYLNHITPLRQQLVRKPYPFPTLTILKPREKMMGLRNLQMEDIRLDNYVSYEPIKMEMAV
jgi:thymidylate synthase